MTEKQKKLAIIAGVVIIALILLFSSRKAGGTTVINQEAAPKYEVSMPGLNMPINTVERLRDMLRNTISLNQFSLV
jgi:hypothetical protein